MSAPLAETALPGQRRAVWPQPHIGAQAVMAVLAVLTGLVFVALYAPIFLVALLSFFRLRRGEIQWDSFSLQWYGKLFSNEGLGQALANSIIVGFGSVLVALVFGMLLAFYVNTRRGPWTVILQFVVFLPFLLPPIITGLSLLVFFNEWGVSRGLLTVIVGHTLFILALAYRTVLTRLQALNRNLLEASQDLGATRWQTFRYVLFPHLKLAIVTAALLAFALSFDETMITLFLVGDTNTLPIRLFAMMRAGFTPEVNALVTLILVFSIVLTLAIARFIGRGGAGGQFRL